MSPELDQLLSKLRASPSMSVTKIISSPDYEDNRHQGVYCISTPDDSEIVYVGRTIGAKDGVAQRIWDHAKNISALRSNLGGPPDFGEYRVRSIPVNSFSDGGRLCARIELYGIAVLDPRGNQLGKAP